MSHSHSHIDQHNREAAYLRLEKARSATEQASSNSMEAQHIMEGLLNTGIKLGALMMGMIGSCGGCSGM